MRSFLNSVASFTITTSEISKKLACRNGGDVTCSTFFSENDLLNDRFVRAVTITSFISIPTRTSSQAGRVREDEAIRDKI